MLNDHDALDLVAVVGACRKVISFVRNDQMIRPALSLTHTNYSTRTSSTHFRAYQYLYPLFITSLKHQKVVKLT